ncbi:DEAD/DEAH box helicase, partial [Streptomyces sp. S3(2020)]|uniref:DEAD/DEAH box helicase n=1 Tax=Streptomyces sp. S3(2020) TaxID=2732044 RepID=UPI00321639F2
MIRYDALDALPVRGALPGLADALDAHGTAVLVAPTGSGKTTLVPLALAGLLDGDAPARRVVVAEPRRIAARAAARRMAWLLGEKVGGSVGYTVRGERVVGPRARVEVVTTGVLLQRLQRDQELVGVDVVVLDECHERHLDADTTAAPPHRHDRRPPPARGRPARPPPPRPGNDPPPRRTATATTPGRRRRSDGAHGGARPPQRRGRRGRA